MVTSARDIQNHLNLPFLEMWGMICFPCLIYRIIYICCIVLNMDSVSCLCMLSLILSFGGVVSAIYQRRLNGYKDLGSQLVFALPEPVWKEGGRGRPAY
jgi:hypothetical protein